MEPHALDAHIYKKLHAGKSLRATTMPPLHSDLTVCSMHKKCRFLRFENLMTTVCSPRSVMPCVTVTCQTIFWVFLQLWPNSILCRLHYRTETTTPTTKHHAKKSASVDTDLRFPEFISKWRSVASFMLRPSLQLSSIWLTGYSRTEGENNLALRSLKPHSIPQ